MRKLMLLLLLVLGCSSESTLSVGCSTKVVDPYMATIARYFDADLTPLEWTKQPSDSTSDHYELLDQGVDTPDDVQHIVARSIAQSSAVNSFSLEEAAPDTDTIEEITFRIRGQYIKWMSNSPHRVHFDLYHTGGTVFIGRVTVDLSTQSAGAFHEYGPFTFGALSLTKAQGDDLTCQVIADVSTDTPGRDLVYISEVEFVYDYIFIPPLSSEQCIDADFRTEQAVGADFDMEQSISAEFSTTVVIVGTVSEELLISQAPTEPAPVVVLPSVDPDAVNEVCFSAEFLSVVNMTASFVAEQSFSVSVPEC